MKKERNLTEKRNTIKKFWPTVIVLIIGISVLGLSYSEEHEILFEKAKFTMETKGDLNTAIKLFEDLITKYPKQREYAAKSQFYIGICSEKLGLDAAKKAFQSVIDKYPEQKKTVNLALEKLTQILKTDEGISEKREGIQIQRFWPNPIDTMGDPSPDGRYISYVDWDSDNLAIHDTLSGENRILTQNTSKDEFVMYSKWSPDGKTIAYIWYNKDEYWDLRILSPNNPKPQILLSDRDYQPFLLGNWSKDSKEILVSCYGTNSVIFGLVSVEDGSFKSIKTIKNKRSRNFRLSPNGDYVAYDFNHSPSNFDISIISIKSGQERPLIQHPAYDYLLDWTPDGKKILFASNRTKNYDIWAIEFENGTPIGNPILVHANVGRIFPMKLTKDGSFVYYKSNTKSDVYLAEFNFETGENITPPKKISTLIEGGNYLSEISPDGKHLAYISSRTSGPRINSSTENTICIYSLETDTQKDYISDLEIYTFYRMRWSPDSNHILFLARDNDDVPGLYNLDIRTGEIKTIVKSAKNNSFFAFDSFGKTVFYRERKQIENDKSNIGIYRQDIESGKQKLIYSSKSRPNALTLSPDNNLFAFYLQETKNENKTYRLMILPAKGGEPRELFSETDAGNFFQIGWTQDNKNIILTKWEPNEEGPSKYELWHVPLDGSPRKKLDIDMGWVRSVSVHPDKRRMTFAAGVTGDYDIWIINNFLSLLENRK